ncbi:MAG TPA: ribonuclease HI family protein [Alphaproteobacteria bacterium]|jgi:ribonuclease HI|nr:ribonuclease HI family protein [Alphaproteobacteria bacterium]
MEEGLIINTDGGSRGNPGPAACAFVVSKNDVVIFEGSKFLGNNTNNFAEYSGVVIALEYLLSSKLFTVDRSPITFFLDSELVVKQLNGLYKVKDENLHKLFLEVKSLITKTNKKVIFKHVPREQNKQADLLVNQRLDNSEISLDFA